VTAVDSVAGDGPAPAAEQRFLSPFNTRVGHAADGGDDDSAGGGDGSDDEGAAPGYAGGRGDADDDAEVMDRSKLKKMSEKMLRYRTRMAIPGMFGGAAPGGVPLLLQVPMRQGGRVFQPRVPDQPPGPQENDRGLQPSRFPLKSEVMSPPPARGAPPEAATQKRWRR